MKDHVVIWLENERVLSSIESSFRFQEKDIIHMSGRVYKVLAVNFSHGGLPPDDWLTHTVKVIEVPL